MGLIPEVLLSALCAFGLFCVGWWLLGRLLGPIPAGGTQLVLAGRGDGEGLEQGIRRVQWLRGLGLVRCPVVIADVGLTPAGRELALHLALRWPDVVVWPGRDLADLLDGAAET